MAAKKNMYVPLHAIIVARPDPKNEGQTVHIDTLAEHKKTGKAFEFTKAEIDEITAHNDGNIGLSLREAADETSNDVETAAEVQPEAAADRPHPTKGKAASKDTDL
jgi:hypothetical protein